jgi:hypothetical protein
MNCPKCGENIYNTSNSGHLCPNMTIPTLYQVDTLNGTVAPIATLRDQFAMAALTGILATNPKGVVNDHIEEILARTVYQLADAMLKVRGENA